MFVYTKNIDGLQKLFVSSSDQKTSEDKEVTYLDENGNIIELIQNDSYFDNGHGGIIRGSDQKEIRLFKDRINLLPATSDVYQIFTSISHIKADLNNSITCTQNNSVILKFSADENYILPNNVIVIGADFIWEINNKVGYLTISKPISNVYISIIANTTYEILPTAKIIKLSGSISAPVVIQEQENQDVVVYCDNMMLNFANEAVGINCISAKSVTFVFKSNTANFINNCTTGILAACPILFFGDATSQLFINNCEIGIDINNILDIQQAHINISSKLTKSKGLVAEASTSNINIFNSYININTVKAGFDLFSLENIINIQNTTLLCNSSSGKCFETVSTLPVILNYITINFNSKNTALTTAGDLNLNYVGGSIVSKTKHALKVDNNLQLLNSTLDLQTHCSFKLSTLEEGSYIYIPEDYKLQTNEEFLLDYIGQFIKVPVSDKELYSKFNFYTLDKSKGLNIAKDILIDNSVLTITSNDDCINSEIGNITIDNSNIVLWTCDDAIKVADNIIIGHTLSNNVEEDTITKVVIKKAFEGIEGQTITINSGNHYFKSFNDTLILRAQFPKTTPIFTHNNGITYCYSDRDDSLDLRSGGNINILGGKFYCSCPFGMLTTIFDITKPGGSSLNISPNATFIHLSNPKSYIIPTLASEQLAILCDLKYNTPGTTCQFLKNYYVSLVNDNKQFVIRLPQTFVTSAVWIDRYCVAMAGLSLLLSTSGLKNGNYKCYLLKKYAGPLLQLTNIVSIEDTDIIDYVDLGNINFDRDTTQIFSTETDCTEVSYGISINKTVRLSDTFTYIWPVFGRSCLKSDGTYHQIGLDTKY